MAVTSQPCYSVPLPNYRLPTDMKFILVDEILALDANRAVTLKNVSAAEEYLADHFPGFPVLPGVFMLEAMVAAARLVLEQRGIPRMVLGEVKALRDGSFVPPGEGLRVEVELIKDLEGEKFGFKGVAYVVRPEMTDGDLDTAVSGRFTMRPITT